MIEGGGVEGCGVEGGGIGGKGGVLGEEGERLGDLMEKVVGNIGGWGCWVGDEFVLIEGLGYGGVKKVFWEVERERGGGVIGVWGRIVMIW